MTRIFEGTQGQDNTDAILANGKVGIECPRTLAPDAILTIESVWYWVPDVNSNIELYWQKQPILPRISPDMSPMPADGKVGIGYLMPTSNIESYHHWLPSVTEYPRLTVFDY